MKDSKTCAALPEGCARLLVVMAAAFSLIQCETDGTGPVAPPIVTCDDPSTLRLAPRPLSPHRRDTLPVVPATLEGTTWAKGDAVRAFFGDKDVKLVFTLTRKMYLVEYAGGEAAVTLISHNDEGLSAKSGSGSINSPLFSPDGKKIVFAGTTLGKPAFIQDAVGGNAMAMRIPLDPKARVTADPHWHREGGRTWIYFATLSGLVGINENCRVISGSTYRVEVLGDSVGPIETTGIRGAYRGGLSRDGKWAGTTYAASALFDRARDTTHFLAPRQQQCNPSMNPFPPGSKRSDYMMILAFGGTRYPSIEGDSLTEGLHENLWIYNRNNRIVWQAPRPNPTEYERWDKPEWSTHPRYASAVALRMESSTGDLVIVRIADLAEAEEGKLHKADPATDYLKIAEGGFTSESYSHLWVAE